MIFSKKLNNFFILKKKLRVFQSSQFFEARISVYNLSFLQV